MYCQRLDKNDSAIRIVGSGKKGGLSLLRRIDDLVRESQQQLCQTTLSCCIIAQDGREGGIAERLGQALAERFTSTGVIAEAVWSLVEVAAEDTGNRLTEGSI